jgi:hypothetical protein
MQKQSEMSIFIEHISGYLLCVFINVRNIFSKNSVLIFDKKFVGNPSVNIKDVQKTTHLEYKLSRHTLFFYFKLVFIRD